MFSESNVNNKDIYINKPPLPVNVFSDVNTRVFSLTLRVEMILKDPVHIVWKIVFYNNLVPVILGGWEFE